MLSSKHMIASVQLSWIHQIFFFWKLNVLDTLHDAIRITKKRDKTTSYFSNSETVPYLKKKTVSFDVKKLLDLIVPKFKRGGELTF